MSVHQFDDPPQLQHANLLPRGNVTLERTSTHVRIIVPPLPTWRHLNKGFFIGGATLPP